MSDTRETATRAAGPMQDLRCQSVRPPRRCKQGPRYACPFVKHNASRYDTVFGPCTQIPGLAPKYVKEHVTRYHSAKAGCLYCNCSWADAPDWERAMIQHLQRGECTNLEHVDNLPEWMSATQHDAIDSLGRGGKGTTYEKWQRLYTSLFPHDSRVHEAEYDYYVRNRSGDDRSSPSTYDEDLHGVPGEISFASSSPCYGNSFDDPHFSQQETESGFEPECGDRSNLQWQTSQTFLDVRRAVRLKDMHSLDIDVELPTFAV